MKSGIPDFIDHTYLESTKFYAKLTDLMLHDALKKLSESDQAVFKSDVAFKYANDDKVMRRLCGLK